jgi:hypothetical protein
MRNAAAQTPTLACRVDGCVWEMEDWLPTGNPTLLHPLMAAYCSHHTLNAHRHVLVEMLSGQDEYTVDDVEAEIRQTFVQFGLDPDDPYEHLELEF